MPFPVIKNRIAVQSTSLVNPKVFDYPPNLVVGDYLYFFLRCTYYSSTMTGWGLVFYNSTYGVTVWKRKITGDEGPTFSYPVYNSYAAGVLYHLDGRYHQETYLVNYSTTTSAPALTVPWTEDSLFISAFTSSRSNSIVNSAPADWDDGDPFADVLSVMSSTTPSTSTSHRFIAVAQRYFPDGSDSAAATWSITNSYQIVSITLALHGIAPWAQIEDAEFDPFVMTMTASQFLAAPINELGPGAEVEFFPPFEFAADIVHVPLYPSFYETFWGTYEYFVGPERKWVSSFPTVLSERGFEFYWYNTSSTLYDWGVRPDHSSYPAWMAGNLDYEAAFTINKYNELNANGRKLFAGMQQRDTTAEFFIELQWLKEINGFLLRPYYTGYTTLPFTSIPLSIGQRITFRLKELPSISVTTSQWEMYYKIGDGSWILLHTTPPGAVPKSHTNYPYLGGNFGVFTRVYGTGGETDLSWHYVVVRTDFCMWWTDPVWPDFIKVKGDIISGDTRDWPQPTMTGLTNERIGVMSSITSYKADAFFTQARTSILVSSLQTMEEFRSKFFHELNVVSPFTNSTVSFLPSDLGASTSELMYPMRTTIAGGAYIYAYFYFRPTYIYINRYGGFRFKINGKSAFFGWKGRETGGGSGYPVLVVDGVEYVATSYQTLITRILRFVIENNTFTAYYASTAAVLGTVQFTVPDFMGSPDKYVLTDFELYSDYYLMSTFNQYYYFGTLEVHADGDAASLVCELNPIDTTPATQGNVLPVIYADPGFFLHRSELTGGGISSVDGIDPLDIDGTGQALTLGSAVWVITDTNDMYLYRAWNAPGQTELLPDIIIPDTNAGDWYWELVRVKAFMPAKQHILTTGLPNGVPVAIDPSFYGYDVFTCYEHAVTNRITRLGVRLFSDGTASQTDTSSALGLVKFLSFPYTPIGARYKT